MSIDSALRDYGYSPFFESSFASTAGEGETPARVIEEQRGRYGIVRLGPEGGIVEEEAQASGSLRQVAWSASAMPTAGDWVSVKPSRGGPTMVRSVLRRRSAFIRKAPGDVRHDRIDAQVVAANVDRAFIVVAAGADWNARRIERYVALARAASVLPVLVITKADLAKSPGATLTPDTLLVEAARAAPGIETALVCALDGGGMDALASSLAPGETVVLIGSSGAGKSTLLNALADRALARVDSVREDDQRGRHTTTIGSCTAWTGALVIDTPGMRELQLWADEEEVGSAFPDIEALAAGCRFRDCRHEREPGCAVRAALESGGLDEGRYEGWRKLAKEAAFLRTKEEWAAREAERLKWRTIAMSRGASPRRPRELAVRREGR